MANWFSRLFMGRSQARGRQQDGEYQDFLYSEDYGDKEYDEKPDEFDEF